MINTMILVSGTPATGKTTFAEWLSSEMCIPLVTRDRLFYKYVEIAKLHLDEEQRAAIVPSNQTILFEHSTLLFWFFCEEIMKSSSPLIIETAFTEKMKEAINDLIKKYKYQTVNVHFDAPVEITHSRFIERDSGELKNLPLESWKKLFEQDGNIKDSHNFRYGNCIIYVDTTDFSTVSYKDIAEQIRQRTLGTN